MMRWMVAGACGLFAPSVALACSFEPPQVMTPDPSLDDDVPPGPAVVTVTEIYRGVGPKPAGCGSVSATSCDDLGRVVLSLRQEDASVPVDAVGYRLAVVDGMVPDGLGIGEDIVLGPEILLPWIDDAEDVQEVFAFTLQVTSVDRAGNEGPPVELEVSDPGRGGCGGTSPAWLLLLTVPWLRRRHQAQITLTSP